MALAEGSIDGPAAAAALADSELKDSPVEVMLLIGMSGQNKVCGMTRLATSASTGHAEAQKAGVLRAALAMPIARAFIIAHNHVSGTLQPSPQDLAFLDTMAVGFDAVGLVLLDFLIVTPDGGAWSVPPNREERGPYANGSLLLGRRSA